MAVTQTVTAISAPWPDRGGYPQLLIAGHGLGCAMLLGLQRGLGDARTDILKQRGKDNVQAVKRVQPDDLTIFWQD